MRLPWLLLALHGVNADSREPDPVAVIAGLTGSAEIQGVGADRPHPAVVFEWLREGARITVNGGSQVLLAFATGQRHEMDAGAQSLVHARGPRVLKGSVREIAPLPPLPMLPGIAPEEAPGRRAGAMRVRGELVTGMYPRAPARTIADSTTLHFQPVPRIRNYVVTIEDDSGNVIFRAESSAAGVPVRPGVLSPGSRYTWFVRGRDESGNSRRGEAEFETLPAQVAERRQDLQLAGTDATPGWAGLLAEIDRRLGLLDEARAGFEKALALRPEDPDLQRSLDAVRAQLREP